MEIDEGLGLDNGDLVGEGVGKTGGKPGTENRENRGKNRGQSPFYVSEIGDCP